MIKLCTCCGSKNGIETKITITQVSEAFSLGAPFKTLAAPLRSQKTTSSILLKTWKDLRRDQPEQDYNQAISNYIQRPNVFPHVGTRLSSMHFHVYKKKYLASPGQHISMFKCCFEDK